MKNRKVIWITRTAVLIALLISLQWVTSFTQPFAGQYITGACVNGVLAVSAVFGGLYCGVVVAILSPFCAFFLGIGPQLIQIVPAIALGNLVYVMVLAFLFRKRQIPLWQQGCSFMAAAVSKFAMLHVAVVMVLIPAMGPALPQKQADMFAVMFSWPQLITALLGGLLAWLILPVLRKNIK